MSQKMKQPLLKFRKRLKVLVIRKSGHLKLSIGFNRVAAEDNNGWRLHTNSKSRKQQTRLQLQGQGGATNCPIKGAPEPIQK